MSQQPPYGYNPQQQPPVYNQQQQQQQQQYAPQQAQTPQYPPNQHAAQQHQQPQQSLPQQQQQYNNNAYSNQAAMPQQQQQQQQYTNTPQYSTQAAVPQQQLQPQPQQQLMPQQAQYQQQPVQQQPVYQQTTQQMNNLSLQQQQQQQQSQHPQQSMPMPMPMPMQPQQQQQQQQLPPQQQQRGVIPSYITPVDPKYLTMTTDAFPANNALRLRSELLYGVVLQPLAGNENELPLVQFDTDVGVLRCEGCRGYINPFCVFLDQGRRWKCSLCLRHNDCPPKYVCGLDAQGLRMDLGSRAELTHCSVEIQAPIQYTQRQPMPASFFFVIDVSKAAVESGMLETVSETILNALDELPGGTRTQIGFLTFDTTIHFYQLRADAAAPQMYVISDLEDLFLPVENDLYVNLDESRDVVEALLDSLPSMHAGTQDVECAMGPALDAATRVMATVGGKMQIFLSGLPSLGFGRLANREDARLLGGPKEHTLLTPLHNFYQRSAKKLTRFQISCNFFLFSDVYSDVATLSQLCDTGGQVYFYPGFRSELHGSKLRHELHTDLTRVAGWESVIRTRVSRGVKASKMYGSFQLIGLDLMGVPAIDSDKAYVFELTNEDEAIATSGIIVQSALLYTTSWGERRIRIHTHRIPVVSTLAPLYNGVNMVALINHLTKYAIGCVVKSGFEKARSMIKKTCYAILRNFKNSTNQQYETVQKLAGLPLLCLGILKHRAFRKGSDVRVDTRAWLFSSMRTMGLTELEAALRPRLMGLHSLEGKQGLLQEPFVLPTELSLSVNELKSNGAYLLDNGFDFFLWLGPQIPEQFSAQLFDGKKQALKLPDNDPSSFANRFHNILRHLRGLSQRYQQLVVIQADQPSEQYFKNQLIEDASLWEMSFEEFAKDIQRKTGFAFPQQQQQQQQMPQQQQQQMPQQQQQMPQQPQYPPQY